jgi:hypothetical protein
MMGRDRRPTRAVRSARAHGRFAERGRVSVSSQDHVLGLDHGLGIARRGARLPVREGDDLGTWRRGEDARRHAADGC